MPGGGRVWLLVIVVVVHGGQGLMGKDTRRRVEQAPATTPRGTKHA